MSSSLRTTTKKESKLKIAVLLVPPVQLLDMSPVDLFHMLSKEYLADCQLPRPLIDLGLDRVEIAYVSDHNDDGKKEVELAPLTASCKVVITHNLTSPAVQPGNIDILFVPGPDPSLVPNEKIRMFVRRHAEIPRTTIMSVCTGIFVLGYSGILDGKSVTGPRALVGMQLKKKFPNAEWCERRWQVDDSGRLWTSGGITNGQEMVAAYIREHFSRELADMVLAFADVGDRSQDYETTGVEEGAWFLWLILRSWLRGIVGGGTRRMNAAGARADDGNRGSSSKARTD